MFAHGVREPHGVLVLEVLLLLLRLRSNFSISFRGECITLGEEVNVAMSIRQGYVPLPVRR